MAYEVLTQKGHDFYVVASLLQKTIRRGDSVLAIRAAEELQPKFIKYVWNRLIIMSAEDCDDNITGAIVDLYDGWQIVQKVGQRGDPGRLFVAKAILLLCKVRHSRDADNLLLMISERYPEREFEFTLEQEAQSMLSVDALDLEIPEYVYDVHTRRGKAKGKTKKQFLREEDVALVRGSTVFDNLDEMIESGTYVAPVGRLF
jgi:replication-associated recombination protein RarA